MEHQTYQRVKVAIAIPTAGLIRAATVFGLCKIIGTLATTKIFPETTEQSLTMLMREGSGIGSNRQKMVDEVARAMGKALVNSPLLKCAVNGNDPNVGRIVAALGKQAGATGLALDPARVRIRLGGATIFEHGDMRLDPEKERRLVAHLKGAELYASAPAADGLTFRPPVDYPPHERSVELEVDLGAGGARCEVLGADLTPEYVTENADYRS